MNKRMTWIGWVVLLWGAAAVGQFSRINLSEWDELPSRGGSRTGTAADSRFEEPRPSEDTSGGGSTSFECPVLIPQNATTGNAFRPQSLFCPEDENRLVRVELKSRPLDFVGGATLRGHYGAARHDHLFVYDVQTGQLLANIGWTGESGETGTTFDDWKNLAAYDREPKATLTMTWGEYKKAEAGYRELTQHNRYELTNAAQSPADAAREAAMAEFMKTLLDMFNSRGNALATVHAVVQGHNLGPRMISSAVRAGNEAAQELESNPDYHNFAIIEDDELMQCFPGENCQLWARNFFSFLQAAKKIAESSREVETPSRSSSANSNGLEALAVVERALGYLRAGRVDNVYGMLPVGYRKDVERVVAAYVGKIDPDVFRMGVEVLGAFGNVLVKQSGNILGLVEAGMIPTEWDLPADEVLAKVLSVKNLRLVGQCLAGTREWLNYGALSRGELSGLLGNAKFCELMRATWEEGGAETAGLKVRLAGDESASEGVARLELGSDESGFDALEMVKVEGCWVPRELAEEWSSMIGMALKQAEQFSLDAEMLDTARTILPELKSAMTELEKAETFEEFSNVVMLTVMVLGLAASM